MKKYLLSILIAITLGHNCIAQNLYLQPIRELVCSFGRGSKQMVIQDSLIYTIRSGGMEQLNINNQSTDYHWQNYYSLTKIAPDTGGTYIYMKGYHYLGRYNSTSKQYENIWTDTLTHYQLGDMAVAPDGKVWATTTYSTSNLAIYDGAKWTFFPSPKAIYYGFSEMKVVNDTTAYLFNSSIYRFHQGVYDSVYTVPNGYYWRDWDVDSSGNNIWIAAQTKLLHESGGILTVYDSSNTPIGTDQFLNVKIGSDGHVWTAGTGKILEFDGSNWTSKAIPVYPINNFMLDKQNYPWVLAGNSGSNYSTLSLLKYNGSGWSTVPFPFMPVRNVTAMGYAPSSYYYNPGTCLYATSEGQFSFDSYNGSFNFVAFKDTSIVPFANDITCFTVGDNNFTFGSHHGVSGVNYFDNSLLPNDTVNYMYYYNGSYYIGTDSGLVIFNGTVYNSINTSNSPLPSNKITYITIGSINYNGPNSLYVGTDKGLAIYQNSQWKVYDTTNIPVANFYVTGLSVPNNNNYDTTVYITTMSSGLIEINSNGYELFNTTNGQFRDDSLYYVNLTPLCFMEEDLIGTKHNGIGYFDSYSGNTFHYDTLPNYGGDPMIKNSLFWAGSLLEAFIMTDSMLYYTTGCNPVKETKAQPLQLKWYQEGSQLVIFVPEELSGDGTILLTDVLGRTLIEQISELKSSGRIDLDVANLSDGVYLLRINDKAKTAFAKLELFQN